MYNLQSEHEKKKKNTKYELDTVNNQLIQFNGKLFSNFTSNEMLLYNHLEKRKKELENMCEEEKNTNSNSSNTTINYLLKMNDLLFTYSVLEDAVQNTDKVTSLSCINQEEQYNNQENDKDNTELQKYEIEKRKEKKEKKEKYLKHHHQEERQIDNKKENEKKDEINREDQNKVEKQNVEDHNEEEEEKDIEEANDVEEENDVEEANEGLVSAETILPKNSEIDLFSFLRNQHKDHQDKIEKAVNALRCITENFKSKIQESSVSHKKEERNEIFHTNYSDILMDDTFMSILTDKQFNKNDVIETISGFLSTNPRDGFDTLGENDRDPDMCEVCNIEKIIYKNEALQICPNCSRGEYVFIDSNKPSNHENSTNDSTNYKHINHMNEIIAQFQAKEHVNILKKDKDSILNELKKRRLLLNRKYINGKVIKDVLKKLGLTKKYGEHKTYISYYVLGIRPPVLSRKQEAIIRAQFNEIIVPWTVLYEILQRKNLIRYYFIFYKLCELNEFDEFLPYIPKMSDGKLHDQDLIWKIFCKFLKWQYIPTV